MKINKFDHITPALMSLHWLPVRYRIQFKILLITFKALIGQGPVYIRNMLELYQPTAYSLRSASRMLLHVPKSSLKSCGDRSFSVAAPVLWNSLPDFIRFSKSVDIFKKNLKTYFFKKAYSV